MPSVAPGNTRNSAISVVCGLRRENKLEALEIIHPYKSSVHWSASKFTLTKLKFLFSTFHSQHSHSFNTSLSLQRIKRLDKIDGLPLHASITMGSHHSHVVWFTFVALVFYVVPDACIRYRGLLPYRKHFACLLLCVTILCQKTLPTFHEWHLSLSLVLCTIRKNVLG